MPYHRYIIIMIIFRSFFLLCNKYEFIKHIMVNFFSKELQNNNDLFYVIIQIYI